MITHEQIRAIMCRVHTSIETDATDIMALITEQDKQYRGLVEAAVKYAGDEADSGGEWEALVKAVLPFLPPKPRLSERLKAIAGGNKYGLDIRDELGDLVTEAKQLEDKLKGVDT